MVSSPELVTVKFRFQIEGTSDPDNLFPGYQGVTNVVRDGAAGKFIVTFAEKYPAFVGCVGTVMGDSDASLGLVVQAHVGDYSATAGTLTVYTVDTYSDATPAAADPVDEDWVYLECTFCRYSNMQQTQAI
jgi:hypothetical protein